MINEKRYTLQVLNSLVREAIEAELPDEYWVEAELSECRESRGHCYMELVEKDETSTHLSPRLPPNAGNRLGQWCNLISSVPQDNR